MAEGESGLDVEIDTSAFDAGAEASELAAILSAGDGNGPQAGGESENDGPGPGKGGGGGGGRPAAAPGRVGKNDQNEPLPGGDKGTGSGETEGDPGGEGAKAGGKPRESLGENWKSYRTKQAQLDERERALSTREAEIAARGASAELIGKIKAGGLDALEAFEALGGDFDGLVAAQIDRGAGRKPDKASKEIAELRAKIEDIEARRATEAKEAEEERLYQAAVAEIGETAKGLKLLKRYPAERQIAMCEAVALGYANRGKRAPKPADIAREVERQLAEERARLLAEEEGEAPPPERKPARPAAVTRREAAERGDGGKGGRIRSEEEAEAAELSRTLFG